MSSAKKKGKLARGEPQVQRKPKQKPSAIAFSNKHTPSTPVASRQITCPVCSSLGPASDCVPCIVCNVPCHRRCSQLQKSSYVCKLCYQKQPRATATKSPSNDVTSTATLVNTPQAYGNKLPTSTPRKAPRSLHAGKQPRKQGGKSMGKGFKSQSMAIKSAPYTKSPSPIPVLPPAASVEDDEDLCMVCDGDCNCKSGTPPVAVGVIPAIVSIVLEPLVATPKRKPAPKKVAPVRPKRGGVIKEEEPTRDVKKRKRGEVVVVEKQGSIEGDIDAMFELMSPSSDDDSEDDIFSASAVFKGRKKAPLKKVKKEKAVVTQHEELEMMDADEFESMFNTNNFPSNSGSGLSSGISSSEDLSSSDNDIEDDELFMSYENNQEMERMNEEDLVEQLVYTGWSSGDDDDVDDFQFLLDGFSSDDEESTEDGGDEEAIVDLEKRPLAKECIDPKLILEDRAELVEKGELKKEEVVVAPVPPPPVATQNIEVKKSAMGPNGEIITTMKTMKVAMNTVKRTPTTPTRKQKALVVKKKVLPAVKKPESVPVMLPDTLPANTKLAIQAASASILKSCGITPLPPLDQSYSALASINPYAAAMAMMAATNPQMFLALGGKKGEGGGSTAAIEEKETEIVSPRPLVMDDLVNHEEIDRYHEEIDRSANNTSPFSASKEELRCVTNGEKRIPIDVFRKSRRRQQRTLKQDLSTAVRVGRSADSVTLHNSWFEEDMLCEEEVVANVATPEVVLTPIFTFRELMSPVHGRFEIPELSLPGPLKI